MTVLHGQHPFQLACCPKQMQTQVRDIFAVTGLFDATMRQLDRVMHPIHTDIARHQLFFSLHSCLHGVCVDIRRQTLFRLVCRVTRLLFFTQGDVALMIFQSAQQTPILEFRGNAPGTVPSMSNQES